MSAQVFEITLVKLYTDVAFRNQFLADPEDALASLELSEDEKQSFRKIDRIGLAMAAQSFLHKKEKRTKFSKKSVTRKLRFYLLISMQKLWSRRLWLGL